MKLLKPDELGIKLKFKLEYQYNDTLYELMEDTEFDDMDDMITTIKEALSDSLYTELKYLAEYNTFDDCDINFEVNKYLSIDEVEI